MKKGFIMFRTALICLFSVSVLGLLGCGRAKDDSRITVKDDKDDFDATDKEDQREAREIARMERLERKRLEAEERSEREGERAETQKEKRRESKEQERRAALCSELLGDLRADLKVTPSASVKRLLGNNFLIELRGGPNAIDLDKLGKAIAAKKWLEVLSILQKTRVTEYPDEATLDGIRGEFLNHEFLAFAKTPVDLSRIHPITLSEDKPTCDTFAISDYIYVNGKQVRCCKGGYTRESHFKWERHPDGSGWYFSWRPIDGEIILVPGLPKDPTFPPLSFEDETPSIMAKIEKAGPVLRAMVDGRDVQPGSAVPDGVVPGRLEEVGLVPTLKKKFELGEVTARQISEALDKACLERFIARRKAAIGM